MKRSNYSYIIFFITITIVATIGIQVYWNIKNYQENRRQLINEVQIAFDNSIEYYYVEDAKNDFLAFVDNDRRPGDSLFLDKIKLDTVFNNSRRKLKHLPKADSMQQMASMIITQTKSKGADGKFRDGITQVIRNNGKTEIKSVITKADIKTGAITGNISGIQVLKGKKSIDSMSGIRGLANKIIISLVRDSIEFPKLAKALDRELSRKNINIAYAIKHFKSDSLFDQFNSKLKLPLSLGTTSKSTYLRNGQALKLFFSDPTMQILKRSLTGIILSLLLSLSIIACLLSLFKTINRQKKADEIKNDLISNITHEFKTPITTISSAIEGIRNFNHARDTEKTERYLDISGQQLHKLETMVEKLLETASLESDQLTLAREHINLVDLFFSNIEKYQLICPGKDIQFICRHDSLIRNADPFHFENAISNLIDNAVKYGGNIIRITLDSDQKNTWILIEDNGEGVEKTHRKKIFDKFYRIPKGNLHDVKGFGIGLYYSRKIIEKHGGTLELTWDPKTTIFKINLPNA